MTIRDSVYYFYIAYQYLFLAGTDLCWFHHFMEIGQTIFRVTHKPMKGGSFGV